MRVELTDEQEFLRDAVAGVVARDASFATVRTWAEARDLDPADALAVRQGWTGIGLDEERGGQGGGPQELAVLGEQLGYGAVPWDRTLAGCVLTPLLAAAGTGEADALAAATAEGERAAVLAVDGDRPLAVARAETGGDGRLSAQARYIVGGATATAFVVPVDAGEGIELYEVAADAPQVSVTPRPLVDATRSLADVTIDGAPAHRLGTVTPAAWATAAGTASVLVAADALGAASRLLDLTTQYVVERQQFGVPVGSFQAVKHAAAEMLVDVEASRSAVHHGAWAVGDAAQDAAVHASVAKVHACSAAVRVADKALFLHGAVGYTWEHDLQFTFKRAKSNVLVFGSPDVHRDLIAAELGLLPATAAHAAA
jgi:alkylation response protein AidB-like acyl-CoA dehydrogenase